MDIKHNIDIVLKAVILMLQYIHEMSILLM